MDPNNMAMTAEQVGAFSYARQKCVVCANRLSSLISTHHLNSPPQLTTSTWYTAPQMKSMKPEDLDVMIAEVADMDDMQKQQLKAMVIRPAHRPIPRSDTTSPRLTSPPSPHLHRLIT